MFTSVFCSKTLHVCNGNHSRAFLFLDMFFHICLSRDFSSMFLLLIWVKWRFLRYAAVCCGCLFIVHFHIYAVLGVVGKNGKHNLNSAKACPCSWCLVFKSRALPEEFFGLDDHKKQRSFDKIFVTVGWTTSSNRICRWWKKFSVDLCFTSYWFFSFVVIPITITICFFLSLKSNSLAFQPINGCT